RPERVQHQSRFPVEADPGWIRTRVLGFAENAPGSAMHTDREWIAVPCKSASACRFLPGFSEAPAPAFFRLTSAVRHKSESGATPGCPPFSRTAPNGPR